LSYGRMYGGQVCPAELRAQKNQ